ncbi:ABC-type transport auxiliary lipoprotein family protein [Rhodoblastus sp.]|uniref:ABC-type transport auxiliary lipoprotein family protein n=1 Tax=Rhodoblastus sp. TaxID=1962975 RepID=UPI00260207FE|nr:ABC-type transport auxiliary lipoprotein family protein [Rhodoblastus sp.]
MGSIGRDNARPRATTRPRASALLAAAVLTLGLAGCAELASPERFSLSATPARARPTKATFMVATPIVFDPFDSDLIVVRSADGALSRVGGARWADRLPGLLQGRIVQTFENAGLARQVTVNGTSADYDLRVEVRRFEIDTATRAAEVELTARLAAQSSGRIVAAKIFQASWPVEEVTGPATAQALDRALGDVLSRMIPWAASLGH